MIYMCSAQLAYHLKPQAARRFHPHLKGSSTLQQTSASGVIIVEDDPIWFSPPGCEPLLRLLQSPVRTHPSHLFMRPWHSTHAL